MRAKNQQIAAIIGLALIPLAFSGCFIRNFGYSFDYSGSQATRSQTGDISANTQSIEIINRWGNVSIQEVNSTSSNANWTWSGTAWGTTGEDAETFLAELDMIVTDSGETKKFEVVYPKPSRELRGIKSHLTLQVPQGTSVSIKNRHGESIASGISGSTTIKSSHGDVTVTDMIGPVEIFNNHADTIGENLLAEAKIKTDHGSVKITGTEQDVSVINDHGSINISNANGNVSTNNDHGSTTIATSSSPSDINSKVAISAKSDHGSIKITVGHEQVTSIFADNDHGSINIYLPESVTTKLDIDTDHGSKRSEFQHDPNGTLNIKCNVDHGSVKIRKNK